VYYSAKDNDKLSQDIPTWSNVRTLSLDTTDETLLRQALTSPNLTDLEELTLSANNSLAGIAILVEHPPPTLTKLHLSASPALLESDHLQQFILLNQLTQLHLSDHLDASLGPAIERATTLQNLWLAHTNIEPTALAQLAPSLSHIPKLTLFGSVFRDTHIQQLFKGQHFPHLTELYISHSSVTHATGTHLANADVPKLCSLNLGGNRTFGDEGVHALLKAPWLTSLRELYLSGSSLGDEGACAIAASEALHQLEALGAMGKVDPGGDKGALAIAASPHMQALRSLWFYPEHMNADTCLEVLLAFPGVSDLYHVEKKVSLKTLKARVKTMGLRGYSKLNRHQLLSMIRSNL